MSEFGNRYIVIFVDEETGIVFAKGMRSKHSVLIAQCLDQFARELGCAPDTLRTDGGQEFAGRVEKWLDGICVAARRTFHQITPRASPWRMGRAERAIRSIMDISRPALQASRLPLKFWDVVVSWAVFTYNVRSGGFERKYGADVASKAIKLLRPFGALATVVYQEDDGTRPKFTSRSYAAAIVGYKISDQYLMLSADNNGKPKLRYSQNVRILSDKKYVWGTEMSNEGIEEVFPTEISHGERTVRSMSHPMFVPVPVPVPTPNGSSPARDNVDTWAECSVCGRWRRIAASDRQVIDNTVDLECRDLGLGCEMEQEEQAWLTVLGVM